MTHTAERNENASRTGLVLHKAAAYDLLLWLVTRGREEAFRETMLHFAHLQPGESVLDVGCGTAGAKLKCVLDQHDIMAATLEPVAEASSGDPRAVNGNSHA